MKILSQFKLAAIIVSNILIIVCGFGIVGAQIILANEGPINNALNLITQEIVTEEPEEGAEKLDNAYYKSAYNSVKEVIAGSQGVVRDVVSEGSVLLKNDNALPLNKGSKVSLFGVSSVDLAYCGSGSSATVTGREVKLKAGLEKDGNLSVNTALWNWYTSNLSTYGKTGPSITSQAAIYCPRDAAWANIPDNAGKTDKTYGDAAIFVLSRLGGESDDFVWNNKSGEGKALDSNAVISNGNVLELSPREKDVLENLKALKGDTFKKIIVLMNSANPVQCDFVNDAAYGIDALVWCGNLGEVGTEAIGDLLVNNINFSGKTSNTFFTKHAFNPVYANWVVNNYTGGSTIPGGSSSNRYVVYQEGIYNGYRYTETRYEDKQMGTASVGDFKYEDVVSYPFGYGLSYTKFDFTANTTYSTRDDIYTVNVTVKNVGNEAGKGVAQIYLQKPYTEYDKSNNIEKAAVELVGFGKTEILQPGDDQRLTITVAGSEFASYDSYGAKTFIQDAGDYYLTAAHDAHDAINNILASKGKPTDNGVTKANADKVTYKTTLTQNLTKYSVSAETGNAITNQFNNTDINLYEGTNDTVKYVTRDDWNGTIKFGATINANGSQTYLGNQISLTRTAQMVAEATGPKIEKSNNDYPTYRAEGAASEMSLITMLARMPGDELDENGNIDMRVMPYDDPRWDTLLDQLSWKDTTDLLCDGFRRTMGVASINKPITIDPNGANGLVGASGLNNNYRMTNNSRGLAVQKSDPDISSKPVVQPSNGLIASSFNKKLAKAVGTIWGEDCLWAGVSGLYGTGLNTHRGAHAGRSFEYYGEDGVLSGQIAGEVTVGLKTKGVYSYLKHCFLNDQESDREGICTWANEQTIREVYLKPFEIAIKAMKGDACIMTGFNRLGVVWTGHHGFMNTVLRAEFGMTGFAVSDYWPQGYMTLPGAILAGNDLPDGSASNSLNLYAPDNGYGDYAFVLRESCKRILYTTVQSNAMNGFDTNTRVIIHDDSNWQAPLKAGVLALEVVTGVIATLTVALIILLELQKWGIIRA